MCPVIPYMAKEDREDHRLNAGHAGDPGRAADQEPDTAGIGCGAGNRMSVHGSAYRER